MGVLTFISGFGWLIDRKKHRQEIEALKADNRQKDMNRRTSERRGQAGLGFPEREGGNAKRNLSKMYVDEFNLNIVVPLQQRVQRLESQIERLHDAIEGINSCPYRAECPVLSRMRKQPDGD